MKFKDLEPFQDASFCFIQDEKFRRKLIPDQEQYDYFLKNMSHERCTSVDNLASYALSGFFFNAEHRYVSGLFNLISEFGESSFEVNKRNSAGRTAQDSHFS
jgi:hypothetical protein